MLWLSGLGLAFHASRCLGSIAASLERLSEKVSTKEAKHSDGNADQAKTGAFANQNVIDIGDFIVHVRGKLYKRRLSLLCPFGKRKRFNDAPVAIGFVRHMVSITKVGVGWNTRKEDGGRGVGGRE